MRKTCFLLSALFVLMMFSCNNTGNVGKSGKQDTVLCVIENDMLNDLQMKPGPDMPLDCAYYLRYGDELSQYRINTFMDFHSHKVYKIFELKNYANLFANKNDTSAVVGDDEPVQAYFNTDCEKNIRIRKLVLDSITSKYGFADTCTVLAGFVHGSVIIEITNEYFKRDSSLATVIKQEDWSTVIKNREDYPKNYYKKILSISSAIDKSCLSDIIKNSRIVQDWKDALRPYGLQFADMNFDSDLKYNDVRILPIDDFLRKYDVEKRDDFPCCVIECYNLNLIFIRK